MADGKTALKKFKEGRALTQNMALAALEEAVAVQDRKDAKVEKAEGRLTTMANAALMTLEVQVTAFLGGGAEGLLGDKIVKGPVDLRLVPAVPLLVWGMHCAYKGHKRAGRDQIAMANGLLATVVSRVGRDAGDAWRERRQSRADGAEASNGAGAGGGALPGQPGALPAGGGGGGLITVTPDGGAPALAGREVTMQQAHQEIERLRAAARSGGQSNRFPRAHAA